MLEENEMENTDEAVPVGADEHEEGEEQSSTNNEGAASAWKNSFTNVKSQVVYDDSLPLPEF